MNKANEAIRLCSGPPSVWPVQDFYGESFSSPWLRSSMKHLILLFLIATLASSFAENVQNRQTHAFEEITKNIAKCIIDPEVVVVIAERRLDSALRYPGGELLTATKGDAIMAMSLSALFPVEYLRGDGNPEMIFVQIDVNPIIRGQTRLTYIPAYSGEGTWLYFVRPVAKLPESFGRIASSDISNKLQNIDTSTPPHEVAKSLGIDSWLRKDNWFEIAATITAYLISYSVRDLKAPAGFSEIAINQVNQRRDNWRKLAEERRNVRKNNDIILTPEQIEQIETLVEMFPSDEAVPNIETLINMKSPFADAIIIELSKRPADKLNEGLRTLKESIPESILESIGGTTTP